MQREIVVRLKQRWLKNEITSGIVMSYVIEGIITRDEALWIIKE